MVSQCARHHPGHDLGCGCGHLYEHLQQQSSSHIEYTGIDLSEQFIQRCQEKHPAADFRHMDILQTPELLESFDYIIINGIFTSRCSMSFEQMWSFVQAMLSLAFSRARQGLAFNAMSKQVDWEREDLFHLPLDTFASFCCRSLSRASQPAGVRPTLPLHHRLPLAQSRLRQALCWQK